MPAVVVVSVRMEAVLEIVTVVMLSAVLVVELEATLVQFVLVVVAVTVVASGAVCPSFDCLLVCLMDDYDDFVCGTFCCWLFVCLVRLFVLAAIVAVISKMATA